MAKKNQNPISVLALVLSVIALVLSVYALSNGGGGGVSDEDFQERTIEIRQDIVETLKSAEDK